MRKTIIAAIGASLAASPAVASADTEAFEKSGLAGKWAYDCAKPASDKNYVETWSIADGKVTRLSESGKADAKPSQVANFGLSKDGKPFYNTSGSFGVLTVEFLVEPKRYRLWSSEEIMPFAGGQVYVADGKYNGTETQWYNKCE